MLIITVGIKSSYFYRNWIDKYVHFYLHSFHIHDWDYIKMTGTASVT